MNNVSANMPANIPKAIQAERLAASILNGYNAMLSAFLQNTAGAQRRFEQAAWHDVQQANKERNHIYKSAVGKVHEDAQNEFNDTLKTPELWRAAKDIYADLVRYSGNALIAQTFFNSCFGRVFGHDKIRDIHVFIIDKKYAPRRYSPVDIQCTLEGFVRPSAAIEAALSYFRFSLPTVEVASRAQAAEKKLLGSWPDGDKTSFTIEFARSLFFRNKAAHIIGRISDSNGHSQSIALALLNNENGGIYLDAILFGDDALSKLFSFARSHFMVNTETPSRYVALLQQLMPHKKTFELYQAVGFARHAKTEFYRYKVDFTQQLPTISQYRISPGVKGMVMLVFDIEESEYVYKIIKDRFTAPKNITRQEVVEKYQFVRDHDRAGRMPDAYEFSYLAFDKSRFSEALLEELLREAPSCVELSGNALVLQQVYVERKMVPLNLYLKNANNEQIERVMDEYGKAIKQLAAVNIFPGDMLFKNFGVTRHGRVVFYDYDEICPITQCNFRHLPQADNDDLGDDNWFDTEPNDVFPEQFPLFFSGHQQARVAFETKHGDIYQVDYWQKLKQRLQAGEVADIFPYDENSRL
ncbi:bifunctional isocitrate dehydrogenase kinase/phosphatase [Porticoccus sp. GXU_MW_L64]